ILNRPRAMAANGSKPYQLAQIEAAGVRVPQTLLTTSPEAVVGVWGRHQRILYKSISGTRSIVSRLTPERAPDPENVRWCPTQFQAHVSGTDVRVHVVGSEVFACEVRSDADDYRYAARQGATCDLSTISLPQQVADRCRKLAATVELPLAGLDLRR